MHIYKPKRILDISFHQLENGAWKPTQQLINFLSDQALDYPRHSEWLEKAEHEMNIGIKSALIASHNGQIAGNIVWQLHKQIPNLIELKNIRISPQVRERHFASFMLRQVEWLSKNYCTGLIVDCRENQTDMKIFLMQSGFTPIAKLNLYEQRIKDICLVKLFNKQDLDITRQAYLQII